MNIEGTYTLQVPPEEVWRHLLDRGDMLNTIPGVEQVEQIDANTYDLRVTLQYAALKGSYKVRVKLSEQHYPSDYQLEVDGQGQQSKITANATIKLQRPSHSAQATIIAYQGTISAEKAGTLIPHALLKGGSKLIIQQYLQALSTYIYQHTATQSAETEDITIVQRQNGNLFILPNTAEQVAPSTRIFGRITRLLHLGKGDPHQAAKWEKRLRQASVISGLLFLVWLGTRIPQGRR